MFLRISISLMLNYTRVLLFVHFVHLNSLGPLPPLNDITYTVEPKF